MVYFTRWECRVVCKCFSSCFFPPSSPPLWIWRCGLYAMADTLWWWRESVGACEKKHKKYPSVVYAVGELFREFTVYSKIRNVCYFHVFAHTHVQRLALVLSLDGRAGCWGTDGSDRLMNLGALEYFSAQGLNRQSKRATQVSQGPAGVCMRRGNVEMSLYWS